MCCRPHRSASAGFRWHIPPAPPKPFPLQPLPLQPQGSPPPPPFLRRSPASSQCIEELNRDKGWQIGIHVDAASGGFIAPFQKVCAPRRGGACALEGTGAPVPLWGLRCGSPRALLLRGPRPPTPAFPCGPAHTRGVVKSAGAPVRPLCPRTSGRRLGDWGWGCGCDLVCALVSAFTLVLLGTLPCFPINNVAAFPCIRWRGGGVEASDDPQWAVPPPTSLAASTEPNPPATPPHALHRRQPPYCGGGAGVTFA